MTEDIKDDSSLLGLVRTMLDELRAQRNQQESERAERAKYGRRRALMKRLLALLLFGIPGLIALVYLWMALQAFGVQFGPWQDVVGVVKISGAIMPGKPASAEKVIPAMREAFGSDHVKAVVLEIDSGGGAPGEAERIYTAMEGLRKEYPKPVIAVITNMGASAAYLIAIHADRVVAGKYSLVGSIGAVMEGWQLDKALARFNVSQRVYASGKLKAFMNPFSPQTPEGESKAREMVSGVAQTFFNEVKSARGQHMRSGIDYQTGEVWSGEEAMRLGLIDEVITIDALIKTNWGVDVHQFGPRQSLANLLASSATSVLGEAVESLAGRVVLH